VKENGANWGRCLQYIKLDKRIVRRKSKSETWKEMEKGTGEEETSKRKKENNIH